MNLLGLALGAIGAQRAQLAKFTGQTTNAVGHRVASYAAPVPIVASVQPVSEKVYQAMGLDFNKDYVTIRTQANAVAVDRDGKGDKVLYNGKTYLCESSTDWAAQAGWVAIVAVRVPA